MDVWQAGLGPIGRSLAALAVDRGHRVLGATDPAHVGADLGELLERPGPSVQVVAGDPPPGCAVLHATTSSLAAAEPQLTALLRAGATVVSTCEELAWPWAEHPRCAERLRAVAEGHGGRLLGTGVNPGFAMDLLPLTLTGAVRSLRHVRVVRRVDAATRRGPLQVKTGAGLTLEAFAARLAVDGVGHRGLRHSAWLLATAAGLAPDRVEEVIEPVVAGRAVRTEHVTVAVGQAAGVRHHVQAFRGDDRVVDMHLSMVVGATDPVDEVILDADPPLHMRVMGGLPGDVCTAAVVLNALPVLAEASPGLYTMDRLPVPRP